MVGGGREETVFVNVSLGKEWYLLALYVFFFCFGLKNPFLLVRLERDVPPSSRNHNESASGCEFV